MRIQVYEKALLTIINGFTSEVSVDTNISIGDKFAFYGILYHVCNIFRDSNGILTIQAADIGY